MKTGRAVVEIHTAWASQAPAKEVGESLIWSKRVSEPDLAIRWEDKELARQLRPQKDEGESRAYVVEESA